MSTDENIENLQRIIAGGVVLLKVKRAADVGAPVVLNGTEASDLMFLVAVVNQAARRTLNADA